mgnify:FL=1
MKEALCWNLLALLAPRATSAAIALSWVSLGAAHGSRCPALILRPQVNSPVQCETITVQFASSTGLHSAGVYARVTTDVYPIWLDLSA